MFMLLHDAGTSFYMQASTDFIVLAHPKFDSVSNSTTVILERILEARASKTARDEFHRTSSSAAAAAVSAVGAAPAVSGTNYFDPEEKQEIRFGRTQYGLEVRCHDPYPSPC